ncbi:MAG TPA: CcmD family protein [Chitinophagaceae bacterium]|jgi:hypothetical protein|nr:CcmD family protein [Chitinophagaceae bacterium]
MKIKSFLLLFLFSFISISLLAQEDNGGMANLLRSNGRIYVVVAVVVLILSGLILYLVRLDRKITKLEKDN